MNLDKEELDILESFERDRMATYCDKENEIKRHQAYAKATFEQDK